MMRPLNESWTLLKRTNFEQRVASDKKRLIDPKKPWLGYTKALLHQVAPLNTDYLDFALGRGEYSYWQDWPTNWGRVGPNSRLQAHWSHNRRVKWAKAKDDAHLDAHERYKHDDWKNSQNQTVPGKVERHPADLHLTDKKAHEELIKPTGGQGCSCGKPCKGLRHLPTNPDIRARGIRELGRIEEEEEEFARQHAEARETMPHWNPRKSKGRISRVDGKAEDTKKLQKVRAKLQGIMSGDLVPRRTFNEELGTESVKHQNVSKEERESDEWQAKHGVVSTDGIAHRSENVLGGQVLKHLHNLGLDAGRVRGNIYINLDGHHFVMPVWTGRGLRGKDSLDRNNPHDTTNGMSESDRLQAIDPEAAAHVDFLQKYWGRRDERQAALAEETEIAPQSYFWHRLKMEGKEDWMNQQNATAEDFDRLRNMLRETLPVTRMQSHGKRGTPTHLASMREMDMKDWGHGKGPGTFYWPHYPQGHEQGIPSPMTPVSQLGEEAGKGRFRGYKPPETPDAGVEAQPPAADFAEQEERRLTGLGPGKIQRSLEPKHLFGSILSVANEGGSVSAFDGAWELLKEGESMTAAQWKGGSTGDTGFKPDSSNGAEKPEKTEEEKQAEVMATHNSSVNNPATQEWFQILLPPSMEYRQKLLEGMDKAGVAIHSENHKKDVKPMEEAFKSVHKLIMHMRSTDGDSTGTGTGEGPPSLLGNDSSGTSQFEQAYTGGGDD